MMVGDLKKYSRYLKPWWIEPALPVILALLIFMALTYILLAGTKRDQLSSAVEASFIKMAVSHMGPEVDVGNLAVVSGLNSDLEKFENSDEGFLSDFSINAYANILERVLAAGAHSVYFSWIPSAHPPTLEHLNPLIEVRNKYPDQKVYFGYPVEELPYLEPILLKKLDFLEADDCGWRVQVICSYNKGWGKWIIQHIANEFSTEEFYNEKNYFISENLPHFRPNYIMNLPGSGQIATWSFSDLISASPSFRGETVFVGPDIVFRDLQSSNKELVRRTFTAADDTDGDVSVSGTPFHVMWSQIAAMFISKSYVAVAPLYLSRFLAALFSLLILLLLWKVGAVVALGTFLLIAFGLPFMNKVGVSYFNVYVPLFEIIYSGLLVFLFTSMGYLAFQTYRKWRLDQLASAHTETANLRRNFIAIVSHNLNTPIAQMQGLVDILVSTCSEGEFKEGLKKVAGYVSLMQLFVRSVLLQSSIESGVLNEAPLTTRKFLEEFEQSLAKTIRKVGVQFELAISSELEDDLDIPIPIDSRVLSHFIANTLVLHFLRFKDHPAIMTLGYNSENDLFSLDLTSNEMDSSSVKKVLTEEFNEADRLVGPVFYKLVNGYIQFKKMELAMIPGGVSLKYTPTKS